MIGNSLPIRPPRRQHAPAEVDELLFRYVDAEGANGIAYGRGGHL
jgi:hypothetical protein